MLSATSVKRPPSQRARRGGTHTSPVQADPTTPRRSASADTQKRTGVRRCAALTWRERRPLPGAGAGHGAQLGARGGERVHGVEEAPLLAPQPLLAAQRRVGRALRARMQQPNAQQPQPI
jgi:hypothetical protein